MCRKELLQMMTQALVDTNDEWIRSCTGICRRHIVTKETLTSMECGSGKKGALPGRIRGRRAGYDYCSDADPG